jgi:succinate dehydrogenase/fumarate reductase flavoprotein subunit
MVLRASMEIGFERIVLGGMGKMTLREEFVETDVLCIGGGIAGLMAAIRARELGVSVVVVEKGNALFSGRGRSGNDHFWCYIPEVHGTDIESFMKECLKGPKLKIMQSGTSMKVMRTFLERSFDIVKLWDSWGIPMKHQGRWEFAGHSFPGDVLTHLKYQGRGQKRILTEKALQKGAKIMNRVMMLDLLTVRDGLVGGIGIHTREEKAVVFRAKSVILATGCVDRLYPSPVPAWMASTPNCLTLTGDGRTMAYRAGAALVGPESPKRHMGPRYFGRYGQATWIGVLRDPQGKPVGPFVTRPDRTYGDMTMEVKSGILEDYLKSGRGPVYMDCRGIAPQDYDYMMNAFVDEGLTSFKDYMREEGIDLRKNPVEFGTYHILPEGKIWIDEKGETSVKGLYAAGDESIVSIGPAAAYGWIAGENAAQYAKRATPSDMAAVRDRIEERKSLVWDMGQRKDGPDWREANIALQQIMQDYAGVVRSEGLLTAGLSYLRQLKQKASATLVARNPWEVTRCLETLNLLDLGELVLLAANERKETRDLHQRPDYPLTNPMLDGKAIFVKRVNGETVMEWKKIE